MIVCNLSDIRDQAAMSPNLETAIAFLEESGEKELPTGRVTIDGEKVYVEVQSYDTIAGEVEKLEGHRRYLDIQYVVEGEETIGWAAVDDVVETASFDEKNDYWLASAPANRISQVNLKGGQLALLFPSDMHAPRRATDRPAPVRKLVVKVEIER